MGALIFVVILIIFMFIYNSYLEHQNSKWKKPILRPDERLQILDEIQRNGCFDNIVYDLRRSISEEGDYISFTPDTLQPFLHASRLPEVVDERLMRLRLNCLNDEDFYGFLEEWNQETDDSSPDLDAKAAFSLSDVKSAAWHLHIQDWCDSQIISVCANENSYMDEYESPYILFYIRDNNIFSIKTFGIRHDCNAYRDALDDIAKIHRPNRIQKIRIFKRRFTVIYDESVIGQFTMDDIEEIFEIIYKHKNKKLD